MLFACAAVATAMVLRSPPPERIVLVVIDTLRRDRVGAYGGPVPTPNIDAFAAEGTVFRRAYGAFHQTSMSMAALFTGRTPSLESRVPGQVLAWTGRTWCGLSRFAASATDSCVPAGVATLPEVLREAGYHTAGVVSNLLLFRPSGYEQGFDEWIQVGATEQQARTAQAGGAMLYDPKRTAGNHVNQEVRAWLARRSGDRFFLYVHYMDAHDWKMQHLPYEDGVRRVDRHVGELRKILEETGLLEGSVVVLTADHGEGLGESHPLPALPLHMGNPSYEPVLAVPLIVWPRIDADRDRFMRSDDTSRLIRSLARLDGEVRPDLESDELFLTEQMFRTYRRGRWKSVWKRAQDRPVLFDLEADAGEERDVAAAHPEEVAAHRSRIDELSRRLGGESTATAPSPEDLERLRALGYVE